MTFKVGDTFIKVSRGHLYRIVMITEHYLKFEYRTPEYYDWVLCTVPERKEVFEREVRDKNYVPATAAGKVLYGVKVTER